MGQSRPSEVSDAKFAELSEEFIHETLAASPSVASQVGYHRHADRKTGRTIELDAVLDDVSPSAIEAQRELYAKWRERFDKIQSYRHCDSRCIQTTGTIPT